MTYESIREALPIIGKRVVEVTCDDWDDIVAAEPDPELRVSKIYVHFDDGSTLAFELGSGFHYDGFDGCVG